MGFFEFFEKNGVWDDPTLTQEKVNAWEKRYWDLYPLGENETHLEAIKSREKFCDMKDILKDVEEILGN